MNIQQFITLQIDEIFNCGKFGQKLFWWRSASKRRWNWEMSTTYWFSEDALEFDLGLFEEEGESLRSFLFRLWNPLLILRSRNLEFAMFSTCVLYAENGRVLLQARVSVNFRLVRRWNSQKLFKTVVFVELCCRKASCWPMTLWLSALPDFVQQVKDKGGKFRKIVVFMNFYPLDFRSGTI